MATIKSYTDLEQSRKLAEILPHESADMFYYKDAVLKEVNPRVMNYLQVPKLQSMYYSPCWSLAALLDNIPQAKLESVKVKKRDKTRWKCYSFFDVVIQSDLVIDWYVSDWCDNPVDACYDVIFQLHKKTNI